MRHLSWLNSLSKGILFAMPEDQIKKINRLIIVIQIYLTSRPDSVLNDNDKMKFHELFYCYHEVFAFADAGPAR